MEGNQWRSYNMIETLCILLTLTVTLEIQILESSPPSFPWTITSGGMVVGTYMTSREGRTFSAYLGIPFAKPPLGPLRFEVRLTL